jgi:hypothetical protein
MSFKKRHFAYEAPRFGRSANERRTEPYLNTVWYLWWAFLRRNEEYRQCCLNGGKGRLAKLFSDFGDIHATDFKTWWQTEDKGAYLFSEEPLPRFDKIYDLSQATNHPDVLFLQVPLSLPKRYLQSEFSKFLDKYHQGQRGIRTNSVSTARYKVNGFVTTVSLQTSLAVYDLRKENPKMPLWEIGNRLRLAKKENWITDADFKSRGSLIGQISDKKMILANASCRLLKKAEKIIAGTAEGVFPKLK